MKAKSKAPSLTPFYGRVHALIVEYHDALCRALGVNPSAKKAEGDDLAENLKTLAEKYFEIALDLGVDETEAILHVSVSPKIEKALTDALEARIDENQKFVTENLLPAVDDKDDPLEGEALVARAGMYAGQVYPTAVEGLTKPLGDAGLVFVWTLDPAVTDHCDDCIDIAGGGPYSDPEDDESELPELPTFPGDGDTQCFTRCRCVVSIEQGSWEKYAAAQDAADNDTTDA